MKIESIIYHTTRPINNVEDKLRIATIFLFCYQVNAKTFAELLYTDNHKSFIEKIGTEYIEYEVDFSIRLDDRNINNCFLATLEEVKKKYDPDGYYKALSEGDEFAIVINEIVRYDFDSIKFGKLKKELSNQLDIFSYAV